MCCVLDLRFTCFFFFNDTATTEIYTLSLHDALPICRGENSFCTLTSPPSPRTCWATSISSMLAFEIPMVLIFPSCCRDRKSTRLNSSHANISYAVFCLKKKKKYDGDKLTVNINIING